MVQHEMMPSNDQISMVRNQIEKLFKRFKHGPHFREKEGYFRGWRKEPQSLFPRRPN